MMYALMEKLLVVSLVTIALLFAIWRLAGPFGRQRLMRRAAIFCRSVHLQALAVRIDAMHQRLAVLQSGSPCSNCGPAADDPSRPA
jgi:hypothetical protein